MFERYTERGRRAIFFARVESSRCGSSEITTGELLLGILREDHSAQLVDLPLSQESKRSLAYTAEEAERLNPPHIDTSHLLLGLLRVKGCQAAQLLLTNGVTLDGCREMARQTLPEMPVDRTGLLSARPHLRAPSAPRVTSLEPAISALRQLVDHTANELSGSADSYGGQRLSEDTLAVPCRIGTAEPVPLAKLVEAYLEYCRDLVGRILVRLD